MRRSGDQLVIRSTPGRAIIATGASADATQHCIGAGVSTAVFSITPYLDSFLRITVIDDSGKQAWSNPIWT